jgi:myo-inositol-1-phosphate synthase
MKAVFDKEYVRNLDGRHVKTAATKWDLAKAVVDDIENFQEANDCTRVVIVWCGSTEKYIEISDVHESLAAFEEGLRTNN